MTISQDTLERFHDSYRRCTERPDFFDLFYDRFLISSDEIEEIFKGVDVERVKIMVRDALYLMLMSSDSSDYALRKVRDLGAYHHARKVKPDHYDLWFEALMSVVEEIDPFYSLEVADSWKQVMQRGIDAMKSAQ